MIGALGFACLSDRIGRRPVYIFGALFSAACAFPFFLLAKTGNPALIVLAFCIEMGIGSAAMFGPQAVYFAELFGPRLRYSGFAFARELGSIIAGGPAPLIAGLLVALDGGCALGRMHLYHRDIAGHRFCGVVRARNLSQRHSPGRRPGPLAVLLDPLPQGADHVLHLHRFCPAVRQFIAVGAGDGVGRRPELAKEGEGLVRPGALLPGADAVFPPAHEQVQPVLVLRES